MATKQLVIVNGRINKKKLSMYKGSIFLSDEMGLQSPFKGSGLDLRIFGENISGDILETQGKLITETFREWGKINIKSSDLCSFLKIDSISLWDAIESNFCSNLYHSNVLKNLLSLEKLVRTENIRKIIILDRTKIGIAKSVAKQKDIELIIPGTKMEESKKIILDSFLRMANALVAPRNDMHYSPAAKKILAVLTIESETPIMVPVIKRLRELGDDVLVVYKSSIKRRVQKSLDGTGVKGIPAEFFGDKKLKIQIKKHIRELRIKSKFLLKSNNFKQKIVYGSLNVWDAVEPFFHHYFSARFKVADVLIYAELMRSMLKKVRPRVIVLCDALSETGKPLVSMAKSMNIPTVFVQYGFFVKGGYIYGPAEADKLLVWGEGTKKLLSERGFDKRKITVTGSPKFDIIAKKKFVSRSELGLGGKGFYVFATQMLPKNEIEQVTRIVFKAMKNFPDKQLVVKQHPREYNEKLYKKIARQVRFKNFIVVKNIDTYSLISNCDLVLTPYSTIGLEALILGKNVISVNPTGRPDPLWFVSSGVSAEAKNQEKLEEAIRYAQKSGPDKKKINNYINKMAYKIDGKATERIVKIIHEEIKGDNGK